MRKRWYLNASVGIEFLYVTSLLVTRYFLLQGPLAGRRLKGTAFAGKMASKGQTIVVKIGKIYCVAESNCSDPFSTFRFVVPRVAL